MTPQRALTKIGWFEQGAGASSVRIFRFHCSQTDELNFGRLFGMAESTAKEDDDALHALENILGEYYDPSVRSRWACGRALSTESLFEELLHETNEEWARRGLPLDLHAVIGLQKDEVLHLASHGSPRALLFRERDGGYLQHFNLLKVRKEDTQEDLNLLFSHIISGELLTGDSVVLLSQKFLEKLTLREVEQALMLNPQGGAALLQSQIGEDASRLPLGTFILRRMAEGDAAARIRPAISPHSSVENMRKTERSTERVLSPQTLPGVKDFLSSLALKDGGARRQSGFYRKREKNIAERVLRRIFKIIGGLLKWQINFFSSAVKFIFTFATNWRGRRTQVIGEVRESAAVAAERTVESFNVLPRRNKTILFVGLTLLFVFTQSAMFLARGNYRKERENAWRELYTEIESKRDEIESSLIYGDESHARTVLQDAENGLDALANDSKKHNEEIKKLRALLEQSALRVRHIMVIEEPNAFFTITENEMEASSLLSWQNELIVSDTKGYALRLRKDDKTTVKLPAPPLPPENIFFLNNENSLVAISPDNSAAFTDDAWTAKFIERKKRVATGDATLYGDRLYILDQAGDNIWRYTKSEDGYNNESPWLKEPYELQAISSFAIDNSLYLMDNRGVVRKFYRGREQEFRTTPLEPAFGQNNRVVASSEGAPPTKAGRIRTSSETEYLYVLDPSGRRLAVWKKDGKLVAQYTSLKFDNLRDVAFDEKRKEIYLLNGNTVFSILAVHLDKK